jgi:excinuclease ABC subunit B
VLVGINLLREGLDLPEVSLVAILDADKEGFLRSSRSLIQTIGRAARNVNGRVFMYADRITDAMKYAMSETERRRKIQHEYNLAHGITPTTTTRTNRDMSAASGELDYYTVPRGAAKEVGDKKDQKKGRGKKDGAASEAATKRGGSAARPSQAPATTPSTHGLSPEEFTARVEDLRSAMFTAAENLEFETAARIRDELNRLQQSA